MKLLISVLTILALTGCAVPAPTVQKPSATASPTPLPATSTPIPPTAIPPTPTLALPDQSLAVRTHFEGVQQDPFSQGHPPDPGIAVGPDVLFVTSNGNFALLDKTGGVIDRMSMREFMAVGGGSPGAIRYAADPTAVFDQDSQRFFVAAKQKDADACAAGQCISYIFVAVSQTSSPRALDADNWFFYQFDVNQHMLPSGPVTLPPNVTPDFPKIGVNQTMVVLEYFDHTYPTERTYDTVIRVLDKAKLIAGQPVDSWVDILLPSYDPAGAAMPAIYSSEPTSTFYLLAAVAGSPCTYIVSRIDGTPDAPQLTQATATGSLPCRHTGQSAPQPGGVEITYEDMNRERPYFTGGALWTVHTTLQDTDAGESSGILFTKIDVSQWPEVKVAQEVALADSAYWIYLPALAVDPAGNVVIAAMCSGKTLSPSVCYSGRLANDPPESLRPLAILKAGTSDQIGAYPEGQSNRTGDYSMASLDPTDQTVWIICEFINGLGDQNRSTWSTWIANFDWTIVGN